MIYSFDVTVSTHDLLKQGVVARRWAGSPNDWHRVVVEAPNRIEAGLIVHAMLHAQGHYPTGIYDRI